MIQDQIKIMFWNCRGAGNNAFVRVCSHYIRENQPTMLIIIETHIDPSLYVKSLLNWALMDIFILKIKALLGGGGGLETR